jgi:hypothetical protein
MKESIKTYKLISVALSCLLTLLVGANVLVLGRIRSKGVVKTNSSPEVRQVEKTYGYVDIFNIIDEYESLKFVGINTSSGDKNIVLLDVSTEDNVRTLYDIFEKLKKEACFLGADNIKIYKYGDNKLKIDFTAHFIKNK